MIKKAIFIILIFFITGCSPALEGGYRSRVVRIFDGDTVRLANGENVRYIGIDTPEMNYKRSNPEYMAKEAKEFNRRLVSGKIVRLEFDAERIDKYNRLLAYVYVDDTFVNAELIKEGYAKVFTIRPNTKYADEFLILQRRARREKKGIWAE